MNPPDHTRLRRLAMPAFSPKAVNTYRDRIERTVGDLLDRSAAAGEFDLVSSFAAALPIAVITDLLGIPDADTDAFARYGTVIGSALDGIRSMRHASALAVSDAKLRSMFAALFELRRREPGDDIVSHVVAAEGDQIKPAEMMPLCVLLLVAGFETTVNLIGNGVLALLDHPEQWEALRADPAGMAPKAVTEVLRYDPPVQRTGRTALETMEIEGTVVHKGQLVATLIGAANRDPEVYDRPAVFDISREPTVDHSPSPAASTTASVSRWPPSRRRSRSKCWPSGCPGCAGSVRSTGATRPRSAGRSTSRSPPDNPRDHDPTVMGGPICPRDLS
jgi:hypothetical protein